MLVVIRLLAPETGTPNDDSRELMAHLCGAEDWEELLGRHDEARQGIASLWTAGEGKRMINEGDRGPGARFHRQRRPALRPGRSAAPLVLYFYPKDDTSGCTRQAQDFTALAADFEAAGVPVVGVSRDPMKRTKSSSPNMVSPCRLHPTRTAGSPTRSEHGCKKSMYGRKYMGMERSTFLIGAGRQGDPRLGAR